MSGGQLSGGKMSGGQMSRYLPSLLKFITIKIEVQNPLSYTGWQAIPTEQNIEISHDWNSLPFSVRTVEDWEDFGGTMRTMLITFWNVDNLGTRTVSGKMRLYWFIYFDYPIKYQIDFCGGPESFAYLPPGNVKTWQFTRTTKGLKIQCNGELVLDFTLSETTCTAYPSG